MVCGAAMRSGNTARRKRCITGASDKGNFEPITVRLATDVNMTKTVMNDEAYLMEHCEAISLW